MKKLMMLGLLGACALGATPAFAGTATGTMTVALTIAPGCAFTNSSATAGSGSTSNVALDFGTQAAGVTGVVTAKAEGSGSGGSALAVTCSSTSTGANSPSLTIGAGLNSTSSGTGASATVQRAMAVAGSATTIPYALYQDAARTVAYTPGAAVVIPVGTANTAVPVNIYGAATIPASAPDGTFTDTVALTLSF